MSDDVETRAQYETAVESMMSLSEKLAAEIVEGQVLTPMVATLAALVLEQKRTVERLRREQIALVAG